MIMQIRLQAYFRGQYECRGQWYERNASHDASNRRALFVGIDAYEQAGGVVMRDLFLLLVGAKLGEKDAAFNALIAIAREFAEFGLRRAEANGLLHIELKTRLALGRDGPEHRFIARGHGTLGKNRVLPHLVDVPGSPSIILAE
jgi:hypothetical protein